MPDSEDFAVQAFKDEGRLLFTAGQVADELLARLEEDPPKRPTLAELRVIAQAFKRAVDIASEYHIGVAGFPP